MDSYLCYIDTNFILLLHNTAKYFLKFQPGSIQNVDPMPQGFAVFVAF